MGRGIRLGHILGIPISIDYSWFIIFGLLALSFSMGYFPGALKGLSTGTYLLLGVLASGLLFVSVLVHELAHSVVARRSGLPVKGITLFIFGGASQLEEEPESPGVEFGMAIVGPLTSVVVAGLFYLVYRSARVAGWESVWVLSWQLAIINAFLAGFNLVPAFPLDGGRVLRSVVWAVTGNLRKATAAAATGGQVFGYLLIALGIVSFFGGRSMGGIWYAFIGWFVLNAAQGSYQQMVVKETLTGVAVAELIGRERPEVSPAITVEELVHDYMLRSEYNVFPVVEGERLLGVVGMDEVQRVERSAWGSTGVGEIVRQPGKEQIVPPDLDAWDAVNRLGESECECLFVVSGEELRGVVNKTDLLRWIRTHERLGMSGEEVRSGRGPGA